MSRYAHACTHVYVMCTEMCTGMHIDMCTDVCIDICCRQPPSFERLDLQVERLGRSLGVVLDLGMFILDGM